MRLNQTEVCNEGCRSEGWRRKEVEQLQTEKQKEYRRCACHRWNFKSGATRSGKTYGDYFWIPYRLRSVSGKAGARLFLGNTRGTLQRNIIEPMQELWGETLVSGIHSDGTAMMFGEKVLCMGADDSGDVNRIRGMSVAYCYGDEVATWNEDVFTMLKSRLDKPWSVFDGTCNPEGPQHWLKRFLDSDADIYLQSYTIDDNPYLPPEFVAALKREYAGTVWYERYILGRWVTAEGCIYRAFADDPQRFYGLPEKLRHVWIGIDFGGNGSAHAFAAVGCDESMNRLWFVDEYYRREVIAPEILEADFVGFVSKVRERWCIDGIYADSAEQVLIRGLNLALMRKGIPLEVVNARKGKITDRIRFINRMLGADRFRIAPHCVQTIAALKEAVWDSKSPLKDVRLDDGSLNVDSLDAMEYAVERVMNEFMCR